LGEGEGCWKVFIGEVGDCWKVFIREGGCCWEVFIAAMIMRNEYESRLSFPVTPRGSFSPFNGV
jgi:hypothetical protein